MAANRETAIPAGPVRRLRRAERREQILAAATRAFARTGFTATSLDDIAAEAGVSRVILYRHFDSKTHLYQAVLDRACIRLAETVGTADYSEQTIPTLLAAAGADPDGFRLLFRHAAREPDFHEMTDQLTTAATDIARRHITALVPDPGWARWAGQLAPRLPIEAAVAWLDAGQPAPDQAPHRLPHALDGLLQAPLARHRDPA